MNFYRLRILVVFIVSEQVYLVSSLNAQSIGDSLKLSSFSAIGNSVYPLPQIHKSSLLSDIGLILNGSLGYLPLIDTSSLVSGFSKAYGIQASAKILGLPFNFNYSSSNNIFLTEQAFSYHQFNFSFDFQQYLNDLKSEMIQQVSSQLNSRKVELASFHFADSLKLYEKLKDTLASQSYLNYLYDLRNIKQALLDSVAKGASYDQELLDSVNRNLAQYDKYMNSLESLMRFQENISEFQNLIIIDSLTAQKGIDKIKSIANKNELLKQASDLGVPFDRNLEPLSFRQLSIGTQLLNHTPLTFYNYFSKGFVTTYNDGSYIIKAVAVNNDIGFNNFGISDSLVFPSFKGQNVFLLGIGRGDLDHDYGMVSASLVMDRKQDASNILRDKNKWLVSYLQQISLSERINVRAEVGKTFIAKENPQPENSSIDQIISQSAVFGSLTYKLVKLKASLELESSYIGVAYFTGGNPLFQPGTVNAAAGWKQELFHSSLIFEYKINHSSFIGLNNEGSRNWYQIAQVSYRLGRIGTLSFIISPYQFNYYIPQVNSISQSHSNFIDLNASFNIPLGKSTLFSNWNFSNYAYQGTFSDTVFSSNTRHLSCNMTTTVMKRTISLVGNYFIPDKNENQSFFINSAALTGAVLQNKIISFSIGPKWLGFDSYSDQIGGVASWNLHFAKHFVWNTSLEKFLNIESSKPNYPSTILFTTDLIFKL